MGEVNPYEAPKTAAVPSPARHRPETAARWQRLLATLFDLGLYLLASLAGAVVALVSAPGAANDDDRADAFAIGVVVSAAASTGLLAAQLWMLHDNGWSIGKRVLGIRIVRANGSRAGLARIFFLRMAVPALLWFLPCVGKLLWLLDTLAIFGSESRCLHDYLAGTIVVKA